MSEPVKHLLCTYAARKMDSNLFMSSTIFNGLQKAGYDVDMIFCGSEVSCDAFAKRYAQYFRRVDYLVERTSAIERYCRDKEKLVKYYTFCREFIKDALWRGYSLRNLKDVVHGSYDCVLSFVPTFESGRMGFDVAKRILKNCRLIQFWTDPLSLGRLNAIEEMPKTRFMHVWEESRLLSVADKVVFCYPLLRDMEAKLHPQHAHKMHWSDIGYIERSLNNFKPNNTKVTIGHFGAYQQRVRNIFPLLEATNSFPDVKFVFRGDSDVEVDASRYPNIDLVQGRVPVAEVEELEANCDALLCLGGKSGITNPAGKVLYYASYNKPILYIGDGVHKEYFRRYLESLGRYIICDNEVDSIVDGLRKLIAAIKDFKLIIPERMRLDVIARKLIED